MFEVRPQIKRPSDHPKLCDTIGSRTFGRKPFPDIKTDHTSRPEYGECWIDKSSVQRQYNEMKIFAAHKHEHVTMERPNVFFKSRKDCFRLVAQSLCVCCAPCHSSRRMPEPENAQEQTHLIVAATILIAACRKFHGSSQLFRSPHCSNKTKTCQIP